MYTIIWSHLPDLFWSLVSCLVLWWQMKNIFGSLNLYRCMTFFKCLCVCVSVCVYVYVCARVCGGLLIHRSKQDYLPLLPVVFVSWWKDVWMGWMEWKAWEHWKRIVMGSFSKEEHCSLKFKPLGQDYLFLSSFSMGFRVDGGQC